MNFLVYQAYGHTDIIHEALYSILSYLRVSQHLPSDEQAQVVVYTDNEALFKNILKNLPKPIMYVPLTPEQITEWRGEINFVHRVKIKVLQDFFSRELGNVLYADTDTVFLADPTPIFQRIGRGELFMHTHEGAIESRPNRIFEKIFRHLERNGFAFKVGEKRQEVPRNTEMWNAGVLGINDRHKGLLQRVLDFTDAAFPQLPLHIIEQLGFSLYFGQHRKIHAADQEIYHYWNFKEFRQVLFHFFAAYRDKSTAELIENLDRINPQELIKPKLAYENMRGLRRVLRKISGKKWMMPKYKL